MQTQTSFANSTDLERDVKLPYVDRDRILMSPGVWNGLFYSGNEIKKAYDNSEWTMPEVTSLFANHNDMDVLEWVGEIVNPHMKGDDLVGDLKIVDKGLAIKLAYGAKMGISPKVSSGELINNAIHNFKFSNFSVVEKPAVKVAYINNNEQGCVTMASDQTTSTQADVCEPEDKKKYPYPKEDSDELSAYTDFVKEFMKKNPNASVSDAAKAWEKKKMSESIEMTDVMSVLNEIKSTIANFSKTLSELKDLSNVVIKNTEAHAVAQSEKSELTDSTTPPTQVELLMEKMNRIESMVDQPSRLTAKTEELSDRPSGKDTDVEFMSFLQSQVV